VSLITFNDLPDAYKPLEKSYCPSFVTIPSFEYTVSLKGKESDVHKATPEVVNSVNTKFSSFLAKSTDFISDLELSRRIYLEPYMVGSFQIKFRIEFEDIQQLSFLAPSKTNINTFLNDFYKYIFYSLPNENDNIFKSAFIESEEFIKVKNELDSIYETAKAKPIAGCEQKLIDLINYSIVPLKEINYSEGFTRIEFSNISAEGESLPMGLINSELLESVENKLPLIEQRKFIEEISYDENPQNYKIQVYIFNTQSGNGSAMVQDNDERFERVYIHCQGRKSYEHTILTHSMDEGVIVEIKGIAKRVNERLKEITVQL
jgi:hypothetical protein